MNCEYVRELLHEYLDNLLAAEDRRRVAAHLHTCQACSEEFADIRRMDGLLRSLPRVSPSPALRERIFSSPEYLALTGTHDGLDTLPRHGARALHEGSNHPYLVALPGGRQSSQNASDRATRAAPIAQVPPSRRKTSTGLRIMQAMIAATILLTLAVGSLIGWNLWQQQNRTAHDGNAITPPAGPQQGPIPAGTRFVFLRDGALWSGATDGTAGVLRLTPTSVSVAQNWVVRPALPGRSAGDLLAYIDLKQGSIHTVRSDGQSDTTIQQPLLKQGTPPSSIWDTDAGAAILGSLTWSSDGNTLAFVADPTGSGQPGLYLASLSSGQVSAVTLPEQGAVSHLVWSPDGARIAFEVAHAGDVSILDYNTQNHGVLVISASAHTPAHPNDTVLTLDWSPSTQLPEITWSTGLTSNGLTHEIWSRRVGVEGMTQTRQLASGEYPQALYSRTGHTGIGSWLLIGGTGAADTLTRLDLNASSTQLAAGKGTIAFANWSPDGVHVAYVGATAPHLGTIHVISGQTGLDTPIASGVISTLAPTWSGDGQRLAYSTATGVFVADMHTAKTLQLPTLHVPASTFAWSTSDPHQLVVAISEDQQGIYLFHAESRTLQRLDQQGLAGSLLWTQIP